jgi:hypothetical protein
VSAQQDPAPPDQATNSSISPRFAELVRNSGPARDAGRPTAASGWRTAWSRLNPRAGRAAAPVRSRRTFRLPAPIVIWWIWVVFALVNLIDIAFTGRDWYSLLVVAVLAVITGLMYAVAFRPRVITDDHGITVLNPLRDHRVPWGAVSAVTVGESVQVRCAPGPGSGREKVVHSWALYAPRRARVKKDFPGRRQFKFTATAPPSYAKLPRDAQELLKQSPADQIAAELELQARLARERGAPAGERVSGWPWAAFAAVLIPAAALVIVLLAH